MVLLSSLTEWSEPESGSQEHLTLTYLSLATGYTIKDEWSLPLYLLNMYKEYKWK